MKLFIISCLLVILFGAPSVVSAQQCELTVVDGANEFGDRIAEVEQAANQLKSIGVDVRVRTIQNVGSAENIQKYFMDERAKCSSWLSPDGQFYKSNFILIAHSRQDKQALIVGGTQFKKPLDDNHTRIIADHMRPHFLQNDYTSAFVAGINETQNVSYTHLHPGQTATTTTNVVNFGNVAFYGFIVVLLFAVLMAGKIFWDKRSVREGEKKSIRARQTAALISKQRASNRLLEFEDSRKYLQIEGNADAINVVEMFDIAWRRYKQYGPDRFSFQPEDDGRTREEYDQLKQAFDEVNELIDKAEAKAKPYLPEEYGKTNKLLA